MGKQARGGGRGRSAPNSARPARSAPYPAGRGRAPWSSHDGMSQRAEDLPAGPSSSRELFDYPTWLRQCLSHEELIRLRARSEAGLAVYSDYSGMDTYREALRLAFKSLWDWIQAEGALWAEDDVPNKFGLVFLRVSDHGRLQQQVLGHLNALYDGGRGHVLGDYMERLTPAAIQFVNAATPEQDAPRAVKEQAHLEITQWLMDNRKWIFAGKAPCAAHGGNECPVHPRFPSAMGADGDPSSQSESESDDSEDYQRRKLYINTSGMSCTDWSTAGSRGGYSGSTEIANGIFVAERRRFAELGIEDLFFGECVPPFPVVSKVVQPLEQTHHVLWLITGPENFGWPCRRPRMFCAGLVKGRLEWMGDHDYRAAFMKKFYRMCQLSGDALFTDSASAQKEMLHRMARIQGHVFSSDEPVSDVKKWLPHLVAPSFYNIYQEHVANAPLKQSLGGVYIGDIEQRPEMGLSVPGPYFPAQLTHGTVALLHGDRVRLATGKDHLAAMGWHLTEGSTMDHAFSPLLPALHGRIDTQLKFLAGNAIHLCPLTAWMQYILANVRCLRV